LFATLRKARWSKRTPRGVKSGKGGLEPAGTQSLGNPYGEVWSKGITSTPAVQYRRSSAAADAGGTSALFFNDLAGELTGAQELVGTRFHLCRRSGWTIVISLGWVRGAAETMINANVVKAVGEALQSHGVTARSNERMPDTVARALHASGAQAEQWLEALAEGCTVEEANRRAGIVSRAENESVLVAVARSIGGMMGKMAG
jgi:hypothetical protein